MSISWKQWEGQVVNNTFPLQKFLGGTDDSAVFLTQLSNPEPIKAAIKFLSSSGSADQQLSVWRRGAQLSHPNLIRLLQFGRCQLADQERLFVVVEYADEDLSQILPERPLNLEEARQMLEPALAALTYLHSQGFVHSHVKPSNIMAIGDQVKLSCDTIIPVGQAKTISSKRDVYTAPESAALRFSPASDVWSLGVTLVETLTRRTPEWRHGEPRDPVVPANFPQPLLDIAQHALRVDPVQRWTIPEIRACLNPVAVAAAAAHSVSPVSIPVSPVPPLPAAKLQAPKPMPPAPRPPAPAPLAAARPKQTVLLPNYVIPLTALAIVIVGILVLPKILGRREAGPSAASTPTKASNSSEAPSNAPPTAKAPEPQPSPPAATKTANEKRPGNAVSGADAQPLSQASIRENTSPAQIAPSAPTSSGPRGEILDQVLPDASEKALATIQGTVRVAVLLQVDASGNVTQADLDSPGPSKFFADLALKASRRWEFTPPEVDGRSVPSQWLVRFEFSPSGVKAFPRQSAP